ncbi:MAG: peptidylprolyl isomerase [Thermodesulfobacteriota bacterium]
MNILRGGRLRLLLTAAVLLGVASPLAAAEKKPAQGHAALVNGKAITQAEVDRELAGMLNELRNRGTVPEESQMEALRKNLLEELISQELLAQEGAKLGIKVDDALVDDRLKMLKSRFPSEEEFRNVLSRSSLSEAELKSQMERGLLIHEVLTREVIRKVTISAEESKEYYDTHPDDFKQPEQVRASHILVKLEPKAEPDVKAKARWEIEEVRKKLSKGGDFAALAREFSQCPSKTQGGDLGFFQKGQMAKPFEDAAFSLKPGQTSGIVETEFGYHLIRVTEKKPAGMLAYEKVKGELEEHLKEAKTRMEVGRYIEGLRAGAKVERLVPPEPNKR